MASILYFLLWAGLFVVMMRFGCGAHVMGHGHQHDNTPSGGPKPVSDAAGRWAPPEKGIDSVCQMSVDTAKAKTAVYGGHLYYFCSQDCRGKFESNPASYLTTAKSASSANEYHHAS